MSLRKLQAGTKKRCIGRLRWKFVEWSKPFISGKSFVKRKKQKNKTKTNKQKQTQNTKTKMKRRRKNRKQSLKCICFRYAVVVAAVVVAVALVAVVCRWQQQIRFYSNMGFLWCIVVNLSRTKPQLTYYLTRKNLDTLFFAGVFFF